MLTPLLCTFPAECRKAAQDKCWWLGAGNGNNLDSAAVVSELARSPGALWLVQLRALGADGRRAAPGPGEEPQAIPSALSHLPPQLHPRMSGESPDKQTVC